MGAPIGNQNASKQNRLWGGILNKIATQNPDKMRQAAEKLLEMAVEGDIAALKEFGDRLDGKVTASVDVTSGGQPIKNEWHMHPTSNDK